MKLKLLIVFLFTSTIITAQNRFSGGIMPEFSVGYSISERFSIQHKIEYQQAMFDQVEDDIYFDLQQADIQHFLEYKISPTVDVAGGYQSRFEADGFNHHRSIQQVSWISRLIGLRIGYRLRTDQTFSNDESPLFRFRIRAKSQFPLQGLEVDQGEQYLVISNEIIYMTKTQTDDFENRLNAGIGHYFNDNNKFEIGLDWRTDDYLEPGFRNRLWLKASYYLSL